MLIGIARLAAQGAPLEAKRLVTYTELPTRSYFSRCSSRRVPFDWTLNPYRGCEFNCQYCYARYTHEFMELREPHDFETKIFAKTWDAAAFREELRRLPQRAFIAIGTATDPYQPAERRFRVTRRMLDVFTSSRGRRIALVTKSDLVARDAALFARIAEHNSLSISLTVTTMDAQLARLIEPGAPRPDLRIEAARKLCAAGLRVSVWASPALPGINDSESSLAQVAGAAAAAGARAFGSSPVFLQPCAQAVFLPFVDRQFPQLAQAYRAHFSRSPFLRGEFPKLLKERVERIREHFNLAPNCDDAIPDYEDLQLSLFPPLAPQG
jgi:DNA repair photolyase